MNLYPPAQEHASVGSTGSAMMSDPDGPTGYNVPAATHPKVFENIKEIGKVQMKLAALAQKVYIKSHKVYII